MVFYAMGAKAIDDKRTFKIINASDGLIDNSAQTILCTGHRTKCIMYGRAF